MSGSASESEQEGNGNVQELEREEKGTKKQSVAKELFDWLMVIVVAVVIAFCINHFVIVNAYIPSSSMEQTVMKGDKVIGLRVSYWFSSPKRGDIVIFKYPVDESKTYIKRVIGEPGDTVEIKGGLVYINGSEEALVEPYVNGEPTGDFGPYEVPEGHYFMLGDNRLVSADSRYWAEKAYSLGLADSLEEAQSYAFVAEDKIMAKAVLRYYPSFKKLS